MNLGLRKRRLKAQWSRGILDYKLHSGQDQLKALYDKTKDIKLQVWLCSRRWGKSFFGAVVCLELQIKKPNSRSFYATAFQVDATEIILPLFNLILQDCPKDLRPKWSESKKKFIFKNGSEITVVGLDKQADKLRGRFADLILIDEAGFVSTDLKQLYSTVLVPLQLKRKGSRIVMISTPPKKAGHSFNYFREKAILEGSFQKFTVYQNPLLSKEEIEEYKKEFLSEADWQREALCEDVRDETTLVIPEWKSDFVQTVELPSYPVHHYSGMDIGTRDKTFCFNAFYDFQKGTLNVTRETSLAGKDMTTDAIAQAIQKISGNTQFYRRIADNSHPLLLNDLSSKHSIHFKQVQKTTLAEMVNRLRVFIKNGRLIVDPSCKELILNLETASWNDKRDAFERSEAIGHADGLQALIYCVLMLDEHTNPVPANWGYTNQHHFIQKQNNPQSETWRQVFGGKR